MTDLSGKTKRTQVCPLIEQDRLTVSKIAKQWQCSESKVIGIALHDWLKTNFNSYELTP
tara:strand:+ start:761 stop:937 length:177 start_codon:yes stop_codon:yes gene_type:complete